MNVLRQPWDYLIVTASNDLQAAAYQRHLDIRRRLGLLCDFREALVVADPGGRRVGSGGSTIHCLLQVLQRELPRQSGKAADWPAIEHVLRRQRILILHAGGDSKRLPAYGPCGKIFVPVPGESRAGVAATLFEHLVRTFVPFPAAPAGSGQVVVAAGDALLRCDLSAISLAADGLTALGCYATPDESRNHGVFCAEGDGPVRLFLQKPSPARQAETGAVNRDGLSILDVGVMSFGAEAALTLLRACDVATDRCGSLAWSKAMNETIVAHGLDIYREVCCALGSQATAEHLAASARQSGSTWDEALLRALYEKLHGIALHVRVLPQCRFLHFGTTRQLIDSGMELLRQTTAAAVHGVPLSVNNVLLPGGEMTGADSWVEDCRLRAPLRLSGGNVVIGVDVDEPLSLPAGGVLDVLAGRNRGGKALHFVRCYHVTDTFKDPLDNGATFCGRPLAAWLAAVDAKPEDVWDAAIPPAGRSLWDARVFPAIDKPGDYRQWLWMFDPSASTAAQQHAFRHADRYSVAEMLLLADQAAFHDRRRGVFAEQMRTSLRSLYRRESEFSAEDLAEVLANTSQRSNCVADLLEEAKRHLEVGRGGLETFAFCRVMHSLGSALAAVAENDETPLGKALPGFAEILPAATRAWLETLKLAPQADVPARRWAERACRIAFEQMDGAIFRSPVNRLERPRCVLRPDETVWGRAPARLDLGGGWTDTPPYTLEHGGAVTNVAINLNNQPPIHCYARVIPELVVRLNSVDTGQHLEVASVEQLLDYRRPGDSFALLKAAVAMAGFSPEVTDWPGGTTLQQMLESFGGGIDLTTLVGIPKGSGLGTSSILGTALVALMQRMLGRPAIARQLFYDVLRLEQAVTTGGGWQDQIGGGVGDAKITSTQPGMFPDPRIGYIPNDLLDPTINRGSSLLYYVGVTRLAKNILQQVVAGYLNRNRSIMAALTQARQAADLVADAMCRKDAEALGHYLNEVWRLKKQLCSSASNEVIESLLDRVRPHLHGACVAGAGGGGFLLMLAKSPQDAAEVRQDLDARPLNERSRFFEYQISHVGLETTTC